MSPPNSSSSRSAPSCATRATPTNPGSGRQRSRSASPGAGLGAGRLRGREVGLEVGTRTVLDVLINQQNAVPGAARVRAARQAYLSEPLLLEQAAGTLDVDDVQDVNRLLIADADAALQTRERRRNAIFAGRVAHYAGLRSAVIVCAGRDSRPQRPPSRQRNPSMQVQASGRRPRRDPHRSCGLPRRAPSRRAATIAVRRSSTASASPTPLASSRSAGRRLRSRRGDLGEVVQVRADHRRHADRGRFEQVVPADSLQAAADEGDVGAA